MSNPEFFTVAEVADLLALDPRTVRKRAREGWNGFPPLVDLGPNTQRISVKDLEAWLESMRKAQEWR